MGIAVDYIKPIRNFIQNKHFRTWLKLYYQLKSKPEKKEGKTRFDDFGIIYADALSFVFQYKEIFVHEYYRFTTNKKDPVIIDCGANIGMCCLYFKKLFPAAKITAFEADPRITTILRQNITNNNLKDIQVVQKAVWIDNNGMQFIADGADGGSFYGNKNGAETVPTIRLKDVLLAEEHIDFLKIDIEGAESVVISDCDAALQKVDYLYVEYHSFAGKQQELGKLLKVLEQNGFRYIISSLYRQTHPLVQPVISHGMDIQLHIFARKQ